MIKLLYVLPEQFLMMLTDHRIGREGIVEFNNYSAIGRVVAFHPELCAVSVCMEWTK